VAKGDGFGDDGLYPLIAVRLRFIQPNDIEASMQMAKEISKMIFALRGKLSK
jgi:hypothetical protein